MDALILSCGTGGGHDSAGRAIAEEMTRRGHRTVMFNPYMLKSDRLSCGIDKLYISAVQNVPRAFGAVYAIGNWYRKLPFRSPVYAANRAMADVLDAYLAEYPVDVVIMPHLFPAEILTIMKQRGIAVPKTIFVATDYVCIPFTEETDCDAYIIPAADLTSDFVGRGIPAEKLYPYGIPTAGVFAAERPQETAKLELGLDPYKIYVLISGGSMGGGKIEKTIEKIRRHCVRRKNTELIVICGSNRPLFDKLTGEGKPHVTVVGHTAKMADYIRASRLFITKPGGLSSTEAAVCGVPLLHTSPIPGCETHNARYFSERGMSVFGNINEETLSAIDRLLADDHASATMIRRQKQLISSHAAADICDLAERMAT